MIHRYENTLRVVLVTLCVVILSIMFCFAWLRYINPHIAIPFVGRGSYVLTILYAIVLYACIIIMNGYGLGRQHLPEIIVSHCISELMAAVIIYFPISLLQYRLMNVIPLLILVCVQWIATVIFYLLANKLYFSLIPPLEMLLVYDTDNKASLARKLNTVPERYNINAEIPLSGGIDSIINAIPSYEAVLVAVDDDNIRGMIMKKCFEANVRCFMKPAISDIIAKSAGILHPADTIIMDSSPAQLNYEQRAAKRMLDILVSLAAIIILSPVLLAAAIAVKLEDGGSVFFRQERLTRNGKRFRIIKFRSMVEDAEKDGQKWAEANDERITRVGKTLRKFRIDELPQFFNVLAGDMSIVGPRPECPALAEKFSEALPEFSYRLKVKAGITGYAQIYGCYSTSPEDKLLMDLYYVETAGILSDIRLILLTLRTLFFTEKTTGLKKEAHP